MEEASALITIAEISLGLAGFAGIVAAVGLRAGHWHAADTLRVLVLLISAVGVLFLALVSAGLYFADLSSTTVAATSSATMLAYTAAGIAYLMPRMREYRSLSDFEFVSWAYRTTVAVGSVLNAAAQLFNIVGVAWGSTFAVFYGGLVWMLFVGVLQFIRIILIRPPSK